MGNNSKPSYAESIIPVCILLFGYCFYTYHAVLYPYFYANNNRKAGEAAFESAVQESVANACFTAFCWWVTYLACKHMVSKPLKKAGLSSFILVMNGSWYFFFLGGVLPAMLGLVATSGAIKSGLAREYPLFLLNMISPLAAIGSLVLAFPPPGVLEKVFDVIAPEDDEPPGPPDGYEQDQ